MFVTSLPGVIPSGVVFAAPILPLEARSSIYGVFATCSGVLPSNSASGSSAMPSNMISRYFIVNSPKLRVLSALIRDNTASD